MQAQPGVLLGFADIRDKRPDWGPATLSPDRCNELPKVCQGRNKRRAKRAEKIGVILERSSYFCFH